MFKLFPIRYCDEGGSPAGSEAPTQKVASAEEIAAAVIKVVDERTARAENGVVKSMASEYGLSEEQLKAVLEKHKAEQAAKLPESVQKQIDEAKAEVQKLKLETALAKEGAALGLVDLDAAIKLMPDGAIKLDDKGEVSGLKEALEKLKADKPYLFAATKPVAMAGKVVGAKTSVLSGVEAEFYRKNPKLQPK